LRKGEGLTLATRRFKARKQKNKRPIRGVFEESRALQKDE